MRLRLALIVLLTAGCYGGSATTVPTRHARTNCGSVTLAQGHGWRARSTTSGGFRIAEATTADFRESAGEFPDASLRHLPPDGIFVTAWDSGRELRRNLGPHCPMPYRLAEFRHDPGWEGQPSVNVPQYVLWTRIGRHALDVRVFFGQQHPGALVVRRAQDELASLRWRLCDSG